MIETATAPTRKKLIEVSIPLEAINVASVREKEVKVGKHTSIHQWFAPRPLASCRAVIFSQLVDDPSSWPDRFPDEATQEVERRRLHKIIEQIVPWEAAQDERVLNCARWEIARSVAWGRDEEPPESSDRQAVIDYLQKFAPPVYDPFSGGASIPLEAQRLGLRAYGSDLNPVAVLIGKALVEIPPLFAGLPPTNPNAQEELRRGARWNGTAAEGLADDVRYYGKCVRDEAAQRIGDYYPPANGLEGSRATVIAWLWARTVRSPDPAAKGAMVPLVSSFMLAIKEGKKAWVEAIVEPDAPHGWRFQVRSGSLSTAREAKLKLGTKADGGFTCLLTGAPISEAWIRAEGQAHRLEKRMMAIVAEGVRSRTYLSPDEDHERLANEAAPTWKPEGELFKGALGFRVGAYGMTEWADLFTPRQLLGLTTLSDVISTVRERILEDAKPVFRAHDDRRLCEGGTGAVAYADAVTTYLGFALDKNAQTSSALVRWFPKGEKAQPTFERQAIPMGWDFAEANIFGSSTGSFSNCIKYLTMTLEKWGGSRFGKIDQQSAQSISLVSEVVICTDPPYYDNIGYADLSDFFYVWLKGVLSPIWPDLFRRLLTPKEEELVATPARHGGRNEAETFFLSGMSEAFRAMSMASRDSEPLAIYYAFKQAEVAHEGITSAGWASFLQAIVNSGLAVDGTWPMRTEHASRFRGQASNALASSIVLVCRKRADDAGSVPRAEFIRALKRELPDAIDDIRTAGVSPVDMQQSVIGPGMGVFSRHAKVLEDDDTAMSVRTALALINRVWGEIENELDTAFDAETQVALAWFASYGFEARASGDLITLANAKNIASDSLFGSGVFSDLRGKAALTPRENLRTDWSPLTDKTLTVWECVQHTARTLRADDGGQIAAAALVKGMGAKGAEARKLAYRLFEIATQKGWSQEALVYNELAQEWPALDDFARGLERETLRAAGADQMQLL